MRQLFDPQSSTYSYLVWNRESLEAALIDPVQEQLNRDIKLVRQLGLGLKLIYDSWQNRLDEGVIPGLRPRVLSLLAPLVSNNDLGMSTGKGFYQYPAPRYQDPDFKRSGDDTQQLAQALETALLANAVLVAAADVAKRDEIDMAWKVGTSLAEGPFEILREITPTGFIANVKQHVARVNYDAKKAESVVTYCAAMV